MCEYNQLLVIDFIPMQSVDFYLKGKKMKNQLFQIPSITESKMYECVPKDKRSHTIFSTGGSVPDSVTWAVYCIKLEVKV